MTTIKSLVVLVLGLSQLTQACPSGKFSALSSGGDFVAQIQGNQILDTGWNQYSSGEDEEYTVRRFYNGKGNYSLWLYEAKSPNTQPGILWGVWYDLGMLESFSNIYEIQTNVRGISRNEEANVVLDEQTGRYTVRCQ